MYSKHVGSMVSRLENFQKCGFETFSFVRTGWKAFEICQNHYFKQTFSHFWALNPKLMTNTNSEYRSMPHEQKSKFFSLKLSSHGVKCKTITLYLTPVKGEIFQCLSMGHWATQKSMCVISFRRMSREWLNVLIENREKSWFWRISRALQRI